MDSMNFVNLTQPDPRVMHATMAPAGTTNDERAELAAQKLQRMIEKAGLDESVAEPLRKNFERLRTLHVYGLLCYDLFTVVNDQALLLAEHALRARFVDLYEHRVTFVKDGKDDRTIDAASFSEVSEKVRSSDHRGWKLRLRNGQAMPFNASTKHLYQWARKERLLSGHRNRGYEQITIKMRNRVAHPDSYHLTWEVDSARAIHELAELINRLWGVPGAGRYQRTIHREVLAVGWNENGTLSFGRAIGLPGWRDRDQHMIALVRGFFDDDGISELDTAFDLTLFPVEVLKKPGSAADAIAWLEKESPGEDDAEYHDRLFLIREHNGRVDLPRRPEQAAALEAKESTGSWLAIEADHPTDAWVHARNQFAGVTSCAKKGPCEVCSAETMARGDIGTILKKVADLLGKPIVPDVRIAFKVPGDRWIWPDDAPDSNEDENGMLQ